MDHIRTAVKAILRGVEFQLIERRHRFRTRPGTLRQPTSPLPRDPSLWRAGRKQVQSLNLTEMNRLQKKSGVGGCGVGESCPGARNQFSAPVIDAAAHNYLYLYLWLLLCSVAAAHRLRREVFWAVPVLHLNQPNARFRSNNNLHKFEHRVEVVQTN